MTQYLRSVDGITPSNFAVDFNLICSEPGPFWMSFDYWVHTADAAAGAFFMAVEWLDPTSQSLAQNGSFITLTDGSSRNTTNTIFAVQRLDGLSLWQASATLSGPAGSALISYRLMVQKEPVTVDW